MSEANRHLGPISVGDPSARGRAKARKPRSDDDKVYGEYDEEERRRIAGLQPASGPIPVVDPSARGRARTRETRRADENVYGEYDEEVRRSITRSWPAKARSEHWNRPSSWSAYRNRPQGADLHRGWQLHLRQPGEARDEDARVGGLRSERDLPPLSGRSV